MTTTIDLCNGEISEKWRDLNRLSMEIDLVIPQIGSLFSSQTSSSRPPDDSVVLPKNSSSNSDNRERNEIGLLKYLHDQYKICVSKRNVNVESAEILGTEKKSQEGGEKKSWFDEMIMDAITSYCRDDFDDEEN